MGVLLLVRHGQASFGSADYDNLSPLGVRQAAALGASLAPRLRGVDAVVLGGMRRHAQTAEACLGAMGIRLEPEPETDDGWGEYDHRDVLHRYDARYADGAVLRAEVAAAADPARAFQAVFERAMDRWTCGAHDGEYGESWPGFRARVSAALERAAARAGEGKTVLVFTSGGPIATACASLLRIPDADCLSLSYTLVNASVTRLTSGKSGVRLLTLNEHAHLEGGEEALVTYR
jgi:broad specificity phosphatase PhoE